MATFESMDRRMPKIEACLKANGLESLDACNEMLLAKGIDCDKIVRGVQPICFDNAVWAYTLGTAIAVKRGLTDAAECAAAIGEGLEAFTSFRQFPHNYTCRMDTQCQHRDLFTGKV